MELLYRLFYSLVGTASFLYFVLKIALGYWKRRGILHEKPKVPWGHLKGVGRKRHISEVLQTLYDKYKGQAPFIGFYAWLKPMLIMVDINSINVVLNKDYNHFMDRGLYYNAKVDPLCRNLFLMDGIEWQDLKLKTQALQWPARIDNILLALVKVQQIFDKSLQERLNQAESVCNITELVEGFNIDVISSLAFGLEGDSLRYKETQFAKMCKEYNQQTNNIYKDYLAFCFPILARLLQYRLYSPKATNYFFKLINDKLIERERQGDVSSASYDFVHIWYDHRKLSKTAKQSIDKMEIEEITAQAFDFIPAGLESCTTTVTCCLYELALQPSIQRRARREIHEILAKHDNKLTVEGLKDMVYLQQVLNETLRKHSPYPFLLRLTTKDYELPNSVFMLKQGNYLIIPTAAIHNDAAYYEHPDKFYPDHFHSIKVQSRPTCAFLPFGLGPRSCILQHFAKHQMLLCLATLLNRFSFTICQDTVIPLSLDNTKLLRKPLNDIKLLIKKL